MIGARKANPAAEIAAAVVAWRGNLAEAREVRLLLLNPFMAGEKRRTLRDELRELDKAAADAFADVKRLGDRHAKSRS